MEIVPGTPHDCPQRSLVIRDRRDRVAASTFSVAWQPETWDVYPNANVATTSLDIDSPKDTLNAWIKPNSSFAWLKMN